MGLFRVVRFLGTSTCGQYLKLNPVGNSRTFSQFRLKPSNLIRNHVALTTPSINVITKRNFDDSSGGFNKDNNYVRSIFEDTSPLEQDYEHRTIESSFSDLANEDFEKSSLSEFPKDFYSKIIKGSELSDVEISEFLKGNSIAMTGDFDISPVMKFSQLNFPDYISANLEKLAFSDPTPIQSISWPVAFSGKDLVGIAQTGSGKTLSFILPALIHIEAQKRNFRSGPAVLVMVPTRELAMQCQQVVRKVAGRRIQSACVYGGASRTRQLHDIRNGCQMVIATPGRLLDFVQSRELSLRDCTYLVLDEADTMLDMGFERDIRKIVGQIRPDRQFTMWSATWPRNVKMLADTYLTSSDGHVYIKVGSSELTANINVEQNFQIVHSRDKGKKLVDLVMQLKNKDPSKGKMLIFSNTKRQCETIGRVLRPLGIRSLVLHGDKTQIARDEAMREFKRSRQSVLVATDVAGRGLDVSDIDYVINFDVPQNCVNYIHRIGRTGRAGKKGEAHTLLCEENGGIISDLIMNLKNIDHPVDEKLYEMQKWFQETKSVKTKRSPSYHSSRGGGYGGYRGNGGYSNRRYNSDRYDDDDEYDTYNDRGYNRGGYNNSPRRNPRRTQRDHDDDLDHLF